MIGLRIDQAKTMFFDRAVKDATDRATQRVLSRFGAYVRRRARQSIRRRKKSAPPGQPPSSHIGLLKRFIFFIYDRMRRSVIVGPAKLAGHVGDAPAALEQGGRSEVLRRRGKVDSVFIEAHPYMQPAFETEQPKLRGMWADSVKL